MKIVSVLSRYVTGIVFVFSGFVKAIDPLGSAYKFTDYFHAFRLDFLESLSLPFAIILASIELVLGIVLILGFQKKLAYWVLFVFMSFFTILTLILALTNPVSDCGCFGDAIIMTNWQTFFKNLVLMVFVLLLFSERKKAENVHDDILEISVIVLLLSFSGIMAAHCLKHLPLIDFRPYKVGTSIQEAMQVPEGAPLDEYRTILIYKNIDSGQKEEFTIENYPQDTLVWEFVTSESKLIIKGYEPPIHDFGISDYEGYDVTNELLEFSGYTLFMTSHNLDKAEEKLLDIGNQWNELQRFSSDFKFMAVTSSSSSLIEELSNTYGLDYKFYAGDEIMLKTMVRSNPGFWLMKNGTIVAKWGWHDFPMIEDWNDKWPELIEQYLQEQDPEILQLIDEGYMDDMHWDMIDFDRTAAKVVSKVVRAKDVRQSWKIFMLVVILILVTMQFLPKRKNRFRD